MRGRAARPPRSGSGDRARAGSTRCGRRTRCGTAPQPRAGGYHDPSSRALGNIAGRRARGARRDGLRTDRGLDRAGEAASAKRTPAAVDADKLFWDTLHGGAYDRIPAALTALKGAYLADPGDAITASHVGWMHIWRLGERVRHAPVRPEITDDAVLARKYFEEAVRLDPKEARYLGFYASLLMAEGTIHKDEKMVRRGYYTMKDAVAAWPEFNLFTAGYTASTQPAGSERYREALENQWRNLDVCVGETVDRARPDYARYMRLETWEGPRRVCWNSWIAPHNFEGFFLNFGDMLVKAGQPETAVTMYRNARRAREFATWPYRAVLEERIASAAANVEVFRRAEPAPGAPTLMVRSAFACMACHQE